MKSFKKLAAIAAVLGTSALSMQAAQAWGYGPWDGGPWNNGPWGGSPWGNNSWGGPFSGSGLGPAGYQERIRRTLVAVIDPGGRIKLPKQKRGAGW